ncbi:MAG: hypothetical protein CM15mP29_2010 [Alphaproteobacteria bacterium]|nr:MAG: hypothetical protein CM15mP29_2010 [Alphaproteobacteria bacterium]
MLLALKRFGKLRKKIFLKALFEHSMGWPLSDGTNGGSFLYHFDKNLVSIG